MQCRASFSGYYFCSAAAYLNAKDIQNNKIAVHSLEPQQMLHCNTNNNFLGSTYSDSDLPFGLQTTANRALDPHLCTNDAF